MQKKQYITLDLLIINYLKVKISNELAWFEQILAN
jgi:hypothetical protein